MTGTRIARRERHHRTAANGMCGFAGVVTWDERYRTSRETLARMSAAVAHRGPDGEGMWISPEQEISPARPQAALAHRRLAIIDPDPRANQPFTDGRGRWIVFNGEIYNFRDLRSEISSVKPDYAWHTTSDTEVLLAAYDTWGERCVERLNGMFAFAVWDENDKSLFLARDRMGQKPLYVATLPNLYGSSGIEPPRPVEGVAFASELAALLELPWVDRSVGQAELTNYLKYGYVYGIFPGNNTIYRGVQELQPSMRMRLSAKEHLSERYYFQSHTPNWYPPRDSDPTVSNADAVAKTRSLLTTAVRRQMVADVPIGCFLSGGVDSSVVAASMRAAASNGQPVETFSIGFDDPRYDESEYARRVAEHLGTRHHAFHVRADAARWLPEIVAAFGQPFADSSALPTFHLARETRRHVKVALSGDGGDELFGGYDRYRALALSRRLRTWTTPIPWIAVSKMMSSPPRGHPKSMVTRAKRFIASVGRPEVERYPEYLRVFSAGQIDELIAYDAGLNKHFDLVACHFITCRCMDPVRYAMFTDRETYLPMDLLAKVDRCSMRHALEVRSPFMDHELVEFACLFRAPQLLKGGPKRMLREAFAADLPDWVFKRKKMGFAVPIGEWFRGELREMLRDNLFATDSFARAHFNMPIVQRLVDEHESRRIDHSQRLYALLMLELWHRAQ
jgi:asparagine synthase (glutamine-hydrolysing)